MDCTIQDGNVIQSRFTPVLDGGNAIAWRKREIIFLNPHCLTRETLGSWLAKNLSDFTVTVAGSLEEVLELSSSERPSSLVLFYIGNAAIRSDEVRSTLSSLGTALPEVPVAVIADSKDGDTVREALRVGVKGFIPTSLSGPVVVEAVRLICAGGAYVPAESLLERESEQTRERAEDAEGLLEGFSPRQLQIIECLRRGIANKRIAYELSMSQGTVKVHIRNIMKKLGAQNRTQVVIMTGPGALRRAR